eukprot:Gb_00202 [translate_table: standard]
MQHSGIRVEHFTLDSVIKACAGLAKGKWIHGYIIKTEFELDVIVWIDLIDMYAKCGSIHDAIQMFDRMNEKNVASFNAMIVGYALHGLLEDAQRLFILMNHEAMKLNSFTLSNEQRIAFSRLKMGRKIHTHIIKDGVDMTLSIVNALLNMYAKSGSMEDANKLFEKDLVSWTTIIVAYAQHGQCEKALKLFHQMEQAGMRADQCSKSLCGSTGLTTMEQGKQLHAHIKKIGFELDSLVESALVDMYAKCGNIEDACSIFHKMPKRNVVSWNAMIAGHAYIKKTGTREAIPCPIKKTGFELDSPHVLRACAGLTTMEQGKRLHAHIKKTGFELDSLMGSALVDMYAKCGNTEDVCSMFHKMPERNVVSWNAMIAGHAHIMEWNKFCQSIYSLQLCSIITTTNQTITLPKNNKQIELKPFSFSSLGFYVSCK